MSFLYFFLFVFFACLVLCTLCGIIQFFIDIFRFSSFKEDLKNLYDKANRGDDTLD